MDYLRRHVIVVICLFIVPVLFSTGCQNSTQRRSRTRTTMEKQPKPRTAKRNRPNRVPPKVISRRDPSLQPKLPPPWKPVTIDIPLRQHPEWRPPKLEHRWRRIVIHHSATAKGDAMAFDRAHRHRGYDELGYHFVIGNGTDTPDGFVEVGSRWRKQKHGAHCKTPDNFFNDHGIGICLVGDFTRTRPTPAQLESLKELTTFLCRLCGLHAGSITTHRDVTGKTQCPGNSFPLAEVRRAVAHRARQLPGRYSAVTSHRHLRSWVETATPHEHAQGSPAGSGTPNMLTATPAATAR
ncbi:MAG: peptidoglycan recognition protein family protein [Phycisphaerae bacterium]